MQLSRILKRLCKSVGNLSIIENCQSLAKSLKTVNYHSRQGRSGQLIACANDLALNLMYSHEVYLSFEEKSPMFLKTLY